MCSFFLFIVDVTMAQKHQIYEKLPLEYSVKPVALRVVSAIGVFLTKYIPKDATG